MNNQREQLWNALSEAKLPFPTTFEHQPDRNIIDLVGCWFWLQGHRDYAHWLWTKDAAPFNPLSFDEALDILWSYDWHLPTLTMFTHLNNYQLPVLMTSHHACTRLERFLLTTIQAAKRRNRRTDDLLWQAEGIARQEGGQDDVIYNLIETRRALYLSGMIGEKNYDAVYIAAHRLLAKCVANNAAKSSLANYCTM